MPVMTPPGSPSFRRHVCCVILMRGAFLPASWIYPVFLLRGFPHEGSRTQSRKPRISQKRIVLSPKHVVVWLPGARRAPAGATFRDARTTKSSATCCFWTPTCQGRGRGRDEEALCMASNEAQGGGGTKPCEVSYSRQRRGAMSVPKATVCGGGGGKTCLRRCQGERHLARASATSWCWPERTKDGSHHMLRPCSKWPCGGVASPADLLASTPP